MQHAQGSFLVPALASQRSSSRRANCSSGVHISPNHTVGRTPEYAAEAIARSRSKITD